MAAAMARGWAAGEGGPEAMLFSDAGSGRAASLAEELGGEARANLAELGRDSDLVVLAVKPSALRQATEALGGAAPAVVSVVGATPLARLSEALPDTPLVRAMPNLAVEVRRGLICHAPPYGTALDRVSPGVHAGSTAVRDFIRQYQPEHFFCGHIHEAEGVAIEIGKSHARNVGKAAHLLELD